MHKIIVYCGSSKGNNPHYAHMAAQLGQYLAKNNKTLIYGAGSVGLMGVMASAALAHGGQVIGVIPEFLMAWEVDHKGITETHITPNMHQRKQKMAEMGDAIIAMPGGFGTLDELFEILTWAQLGLHQMPIGLLNIEGFFDPLLTMLQKMVSTGFLKQENLDLLCIAEDIEELFAQLAKNKASNTQKWINKS
jgi:uncharacterized protein (TIGR00730 family)